MKNGLLFVLAVLLAVLAAESLLRAADIGEYSLNDRVLFYSFPSFIADEHGVVHYPSHTKIRSAAIYGDQIDYDTTTLTNSLGYQDNIDYVESVAPEINDIVFIGDSFTEGIGGFPWVPKIRETLRQPGLTKIYNLGIGSASIPHIELMLEDFKRKIGFDEVNVFVISNDFFRPLWRPVQKGDALWFCPVSISIFDCTANRRPIIHEMNINENQDSLRRRAEEIYDANRSMTRQSPAFYQTLNLYTLLCEAWNAYRPNQANIYFCPHLRNHNYVNYAKNERYFQGAAILRALPGKHRGVKFRLFHIPEKGEAVLGKYALDVAAEFAGSDISYFPLLKLCRWHKNMYHKHDSHPNELGYTQLLNCVRQQLSL